MTDVEAIAKGLDGRQVRFLMAVIDGTQLPLACRDEDRARQKCRRLGLVAVKKNPRRWVPTLFGLAVRKHLENTDGK